MSVAQIMEADRRQRGCITGYKPIPLLRDAIGLEGFANFLNDPRWSDHPAHLETPKTRTDDDGADVEMDLVNLAALRALLRDQT